MILDETVEIKVTPFNQKYWYDKGYEFPKPILTIGFTPSLDVKVSDLSSNASRKVNCLCDLCNMKFIRCLRKNTSRCDICRQKEHSSRMQGHSHNKGVKHDKSRTGENHYKWNPNRTELLLYKAKVCAVTRTQDVSTLKNFDKKRGIMGTPGAYQLDHITSIKRGFLEDISPEIIGDISNLQFIPWEENSKKSWH